MKSKFYLHVCAAFLAGGILSGAAFAADAAGAAPDVPSASSTVEVGVWSTDYDAACAFAKKQNLPVFLHFTGSDWCPWCVLMDQRVFQTDQWKKFAKKKLVLVLLDFPNKKKLPDSLRAQNIKLAQRFRVEGFPTYVLISADGKEFARLGASRDATPEKFIKSVEDALSRAEKPEK